MTRAKGQVEHASRGQDAKGHASHGQGTEGQALREQPSREFAVRGQSQGARVAKGRPAVQGERLPHDPCIRAENEDDDGYDPYSDRRPDPEPLFERDPWS